MKVLVSDPISPQGLVVLRQSAALEVVNAPGIKEPELLEKIADADALVIRSQTKVTKKVIDAARRLRVIGRAGVGVDNVDVEAATARGIVVLNTPSGNSISTAELGFSLMLSLARTIPQAHASMKAGQWDRKTFQGVELYEKSLGIVGMGRIGFEVARRALAFGMRVLVHDPFLAPARAAALQVELVDPPTLFAKSDFITIHAPITEQTRGMIDKKAFELMKRGVRIINCARGGIIVERDLYDAIKSGKVAGAALDVYEQEPPPADFPLRELPQVILTPHLGASTAEAQERVGIEVAEAIYDFLTTGTIRNAVNMPSLDVQTVAALRPYLVLGDKLGRLLAQMSPEGVKRLHITFQGKATELQSNPVSRAVLKGFLECYADTAKAAAAQTLNEINAPVVAEKLGIRLEESKVTQSLDYAEMIKVEVGLAGRAAVSAAGTFFGSPNNPRIVRINDLVIEASPNGVLCIVTNKDRPGVVGEIGSILARHKVNIATMSMNRSVVGGEALTVLNLDNPPPAEAIAEIQRDRDIYDLKVVTL
jgi:D-3-phosphoglycerate dehydrogenase